MLELLRCVKLCITYMIEDKYFLPFRIQSLQREREGEREGDMIR